MPYNRLSTGKIARIVGCHPNTVRLYEQIGFIAPVPRSAKGYRLYTEAHLDQMRLARMAMSGVYPGPSIRRSLIALIRRTAAGDYPGALSLAYQHLEIVRAERLQADAAADFLERWASGDPPPALDQPLLIGQAARLLNLTNDMLRNWERNGLISVPRSPRSRYRLYQAAQIGRLRVIRLLRQAGYSPMAILRMLILFDQGAAADLRQALDTPRPDEDVYMAADRWLSTLADQERRAWDLIALVEDMVEKYAQTPSEPAASSPSD